VVERKKVIKMEKPSCGQSGKKLTAGSEKGRGQPIWKEGTKKGERVNPPKAEVFPEAENRF